MKSLKYIIPVLIGIIVIISLMSNRRQKDLTTINQNFSNSESSYITTVDPNNFERYINSGEYIVIDIRTPEEIADGKITSNALEINFYDDTFEQQIN